MHKRITSDYPIEPEKPAFAPILVLVGTMEGVYEGCSLVALLSLVDTEGENNTRLTSEAGTDSTCRSAIALRLL